ncbi:hypothetical protein OCU04_007509 [Sclerotinia nivalis]|nr:hypothetical protein OCU04_007509 [Sclerotinia nivalis]
MFNPASFWYLYDSLMVLKAMVAEVNNTFDERIMYFLPHTSYSSSTPSSHSSNSDSPQPQTEVLKHIFKKDMHVSPFSSRRGTYTVESHSPSFHPSQTPNQIFKNASDNPQTIDIRVTLSSSSNHPKLFAHLYSTGIPLDPSEQSFFSFWGFMCRWWWVGWCTYPRILHQAIKLAYQKNLSIWYRPEPRSSNVARHATSSEIIFAKTFHHYLLHILSPPNLSPPNTNPSPSSPSLTLHYTSLTTQLSTHILPIHCPPPPQFPTSSTSTPPQTLKLHILTPSFYSTLLFYPSLQLALKESLFPEREENRLIKSDDGKGVCGVLTKFACVEKGERNRKEKWWSLEGVNKHLRKKVNKGKGWYPNPNYPISQTLGISTPQTSIEKDEKREEKKEEWEGENFLSSFVSSHLSEREQKEYRKAELTFLLAKIFTDGDEGLLKFLGLVVIGVFVVGGGWGFGAYGVR